MVLLWQHLPDQILSGHSLRDCCKPIPKSNCSFMTFFHTTKFCFQNTSYKLWISTTSFIHVPSMLITFGGSFMATLAGSDSIGALLSSVSKILLTSSGSVPSTTNKIPFFNSGSSIACAASSRLQHFMVLSLQTGFVLQFLIN